MSLLSQGSQWEAATNQAMVIQTGFFEAVVNAMEKIQAEGLTEYSEWDANLDEVTRRDLSKEVTFEVRTE